MMSEENHLESSERSCQFAGLRKVIDWLSVVDDFKFKDHPNFLPRWALLVLILLFMALT
jgi:hypothetical protein